MNGLPGEVLKWVEDLPTITVSQDEDLKIDTGVVRVWSSRGSIASGNGVLLSVEVMVGGRYPWVTVPGGEGADELITSAIDWQRNQ